MNENPNYTRARDWMSVTHLPRAVGLARQAFPARAAAMSAMGVVRLPRAPGMVASGAHFHAMAVTNTRGGRWRRAYLASAAGSLQRWATTTPSAAARRLFSSSSDASKIRNVSDSVPCALVLVNMNARVSVCVCERFMGVRVRV